MIGLSPELIGSLARRIEAKGDMDKTINQTLIDCLIVIATAVTDGLINKGALFLPFLLVNHCCVMGTFRRLALLDTMGLRSAGEKPMRLYLIGTIFALLSSWAAANNLLPRNIDWEALAPDYPPITDPFNHLTPDQRLDLFTILGTRKQAEQGMIATVSPTYEMALEMAHRMKSQGVDVEVMVKKAREIEEIIAEYDRKTMPHLQGQMVKIPGFAMPLEFSDKGVTEFLLVPYLGACIHTPPPPQNQIVFVRLEKPFELDDIYTPVLITGRLSIVGVTKKLSYVDGEAGISSSYTMEATEVELYHYQ